MRKQYVVPIISRNSKGKETKIIHEKWVILQDNRTVKVQKWKEFGSVYITYFFSSEGIEQLSKEELYDYLIKLGLKMEQPYSSGRVAIQKFYDENKQLCWGLTVPSTSS